MHWLQHWAGLDNGSGPIYLFWSGFFGDLTIFAGVIAVYRHKNCHTRGCLRIGKPLEGTPYLLCHKHHPEHPGIRRNILHSQIIEQWKAGKR